MQKRDVQRYHLFSVRIVWPYLGIQAGCHTWDLRTITASFDEQGSSICIYIPLRRRAEDTLTSYITVEWESCTVVVPSMWMWTLAFAQISQPLWWARRQSRSSLLLFVFVKLLRSTVGQFEKCEDQRYCCPRTSSCLTVHPSIWLWSACFEWRITAILTSCAL